MKNFVLLMLLSAVITFTAIEQSEIRRTEIKGPPATGQPAELATARQSAEMTQLRLLIPLYSYPAHYNPNTYTWLNVAKAQSQVSITAVINPNNGATAPPNRDYARGLEDLRAAQVTLLGYISTRYGDRNVDEVKAEVDLYAAHYGVNGIFLDEAASSADRLEYYQRLSRYIRTKPALQQIILNHGTQPDERYLQQATADTSIIFENYSREWARYQLPSYLSNYTANRFAMLIHSAPDAETMRRHLDLALARGVAYVYITDDSPESVGANPWDQLPAYWQDEVDYVQSLNNRTQ